MDDDVTRRSVLAGVAVGTLGALGATPATAERPERHIVGTTGAAASRRVEARADRVDRVLDFEEIGQAVVGRFAPAALEALSRRRDVRYVEADGTVRAIADTLPWGVDRVDADVMHETDSGQDADGSPETGAGADIAILDTGIDADHPDLEANLGTGTAFVDCGATSCGNGNPCQRPWDDDYDHGTHCAGTAGAAANGTGVVGVCTEATLHSVKVLDGCGSGSWSDVAAGIEYTADQGWDVASMSLGSSTGSWTVRDACRYAVDRGVFLVAAAGNDGPCSDCVGYPAAYDTVVAVSATTSSDALASFSSTGPEVDLAAPGEYVYSTVPGGYAYYSGTSMATPHVAGAAAQLLANGFSNTEARSRLAGTAEDIGLSGDEGGDGLLDVEAALTSDGATDTGVAVSTGGVSDVTTTSATLSGSLDDLGGADSADVAFEYRPVGATTWEATAAQTLSAAGGFSRGVSGLSAGTDYEFRAVADASDGDTDTGTTQSFATGAADTSVAVSTDSASSVGETAATLAGTLEDLGGADSADVAFEYRPVGATTWDASATQTESSTGSYSREVSGLSAGTDYEFRAVADASDGDTDTGSTQSFTTADGSDGGGGDTAPTVDSYAVSEAGSPNPHAEITASWTVGDADGDLASVLVEVVDSGGRTVTDGRTAVSGTDASGSDSLKVKHAKGQTFDVTLTVTDGNGNTASASRQVTE